MNTKQTKIVQKLFFKKSR